MWALGHEPQLVVARMRLCKRFSAIQYVIELSGSDGV